MLSVKPITHTNTDTHHKRGFEQKLTILFIRLKLNVITFSISNDWIDVANEYNMQSDIIFNEILYY